MKSDSNCGLCGLHPNWLQKFATTRAYIVIYGLLGTVQAMAFIYVSVSLTTLERRFKIPSRTTGVLLSGIEISQILSVILIYYGSSGHRPRWIACGVAASALSCLVFALPHFIYGPGEEALALTYEHLNSTILSASAVKKNELPICSELSSTESCDDNNSPDTSIVPILLAFISLFILGIGNMMYFVFGQTYMDDNTKKKNTPLLLGITFSLRTIGPVLGFVLGYYCLGAYIDPSLHPIIDDQDPRWLGAWWLGWIALGLMMGIFSLFLAMFPREIRKSKSNKKKVPLSETEVPLTSMKSDQKSQAPQMENSTLNDFVVSVKRVMKNKLVLFNTFNCVFYTLGLAPYGSFMSKYLEVQYGTSPGGGTLISGPLKEIGTIFGFLISGFVIARYKPSPRLLLGWTVFVGIVYLTVNILFIYIKCDTGNIQGINLETMKSNFTNSCNTACNCEHVKFSPVCHEPTETTYFSACHAGCQKIINDTVFGDCNCVSNEDYRIKDIILESTLLRIDDQFSKRFRSQNNEVTIGPCKKNCFKPYITFSLMLAFAWTLTCSVRVGAVILTFRCVEDKDKILAQGIGIMIISLIALIPAPIVTGALMDSTCLIWDVSCKSKGNCWIYHKDLFNYVVNMSAAAFVFIGVIFDVLVWYYSKDVDLYREEEEADKLEVSPSKNTDEIYNES